MPDVTAILVDDEPTLCSYLARLLSETWPELRILDTAQNGRQALALINQHQPDIVFLDIHMPGLSGLQVAEQIASDIHIVFVTAFDQHAVEAFDRAAVDYLLKPVTTERLNQSIARLKARQAPSPQNELQALIDNLSNRNDNHLQWLRAGRGETVQLVPVSSVVYFQADHKYTAVLTGTEEFVIRRSIKELESELDPEQFWRVHRGIIVRVDEIKNADRDLRGRYRLTFRSRPETVKTSQSYGHLFKQM